MQLHSPAFEKSLHAAARVELRKSPEKWRQYLWTYFWNPPTWAVLTVLLGVPFALAYFFIIKPVLGDPPFPSLVSLKTRLMTDMVLTYTLAVGLVWWFSLKQALQSPAQRLPFNQHRLFERYAEGYRKGLLTLTAALCFGGTILTWMHQGELLWQNALLFGLVQTLNAYAVGMAWACWLASRPPKPSKPPYMLRIPLTVSALYASFFLTLFLPEFMDGEKIARQVHPIYSALPGGWAGEMFLDSLEGNLDFSWAMLPTVPLLLLVPLWRHKLRAQFIRLAPDHQFVVRPDEAPAEWTREQAEEQLRERMNTPADWWQAGWIERLVACALTPSQRELAEVMLPAAPGWSVSQRNLSALVVAALAMIWWLLAERRFLTVLLFAAVVCSLMAYSYLINILGGRANGALLTAGMPFQLPVAAWDYSLVWLKVVWVRALCVVPVFGFAAFFLISSLPKFLFELGMVCLLMWLVGPALAPLKPLFRILGCIRPARWWQWGWFAVSLGAFACALGLPMFAFGLVLDSRVEEAFSIVAGVGVGLLALLGLVNWALRKQCFDLATNDWFSLAIKLNQNQPPVRLEIVLPGHSSSVP